MEVLAIYVHDGYIRVLLDQLEVTNSIERNIKKN